MSIFYYTSKAQDGKIKSGTMEARDKQRLAQALRQRGFLLTSAKIIGEEKKKKHIVQEIFKGILGRVSLVEKLMFTRNLSVMIAAGFSLHKALEVLAKQTKNANFKKIINDIVLSIKKGQSLDESLAKYPRVFNDFFVNMVKVGEKGGNLEEVLKILANHLKKEHDFITKVKGAMVYPAVILIAMIFIGILMMVLVVPKIAGMFEELKTDLPFSTKIIMAVSMFLKNNLIIGIIGLIVIVFILVRFFRTNKGKHILSWFFLHFPFFKNLTKKMNCARFARSLSSLMESGVPIVESLRISSQTVDNVFYSESLMKISNEVKKGTSLKENLEKYDIYPVLVSQMIGVGEETGELSNIMNRLADFYEEEVKNVTNNLTSIIEPILMIIIGAVIGFFAISMIQPMYSMMEGL
ncbi:type II secretion system F family protein [Patescibacteria group bacterium]|nr:type II secretion system F family protein [Patescibacteria group bacterium]MBU3922999.1 type II secretion system F family protein [Patescibacteria group bacterium]